MITFFTTAKPFEGANRIRQVNAIRSWLSVHRDAEVLLFGDGPGYQETASRYGLTRIPDVETNEFGVPRIDSMFAIAGKRARNPINAYINCDIVLLDDFSHAVERISFDRYLMVAQRHDIDLDREIDFGKRTWQAELRAKVLKEGNKLAPCGIDFFLQKGGVWPELPPMVVGRGMYDNWLVYKCRSEMIPVVDATDSITVVHQNHDYSHIQGGKRAVEIGEEASRNLEMGGGHRYLFTIQDADWRLTSRGLVRNWCRGDSARYGEVYEILHEKRPVWQVRAGKAWSEFLCEFNTRWTLARGSDIAPLIKLPGWCLRQIMFRR